MSFIGSSVRRELSSRKLPIVMLIILHDPLLWFLLVTKWVRTLEMPAVEMIGPIIEKACDIVTNKMNSRGKYKA
jgi:diacylglycerol kinase